MLKLLGPTNPVGRKVLRTLSEQVWHRKESSVLRAWPAACNHKLFAQPLSTQPDAQDLPPLPVPPLQATMDKLLSTVRPHVSDQEFLKTQGQVKKFVCGDGQKLQKILEDKAKTSKNWLTDWWLKTAYLEFRYPVVVWSSPGLVFPLQCNTTQEQQIALAAKVIVGALEFRKLIDENKLPLERMGKDPLDMSQYTKILGTCRNPGIPSDQLMFADSKNPPKHIAVAYKNNFFEVNVYGDGGPLSEEQIKEQLVQVIKASVDPCVAPVGILTSDHRDAWSKAYEELIKDAKNVSSLKSIEKSLFLVCLDDPNPDHGDVNKQTVAALEMVHGCGSKSNGGNRWFDKTVQFVIGTKGELGLTYEHSPAEGPPIAFLMDHVVNYIEKGCAQKGTDSCAKKPLHLPFNVSSGVLPAIECAKTNLDRMVDDLEMYGFTYKGYGKEFPKSQKMSPDSYIQMAIQFAFYRIHKTPGAHYESASTRKYHGGRTETIRSCSVESIAFAKAMLDPSKPDKEKVEALISAVNSHKKYTLEAVNGFGVDRHLLGLKLAATENRIEIPDLYKDVGYIRSSHMRISTSQVAAKCDAFMCYGPLVTDGYSCCYNPRENEIVMGVAAFKSCPETSACKFRDALEESFNNMHDLLVKAQKSKL